MGYSLVLMEQTSQEASVRSDIHRVTEGMWTPDREIVAHHILEPRALI